MSWTGKATRSPRSCCRAPNAATCRRSTTTNGGGELLLVEQRPRLQSRAMVVPLPVGAAAIIPVRERPRQGKVRIHRAPMRHGVGRIRRGNRMTLGVIFHDAA